MLIINTEYFYLILISNSRYSKGHLKALVDKQKGVTLL